MFRRVQRLLRPGTRHALAERIDKDIVKASLDAEKRSAHYGEPAWSVALDRARKLVTLLKKCLSMIRTGRNLTPILERDLLRIDQGLLLPSNKQECVTQLREAKRKVRAIVKESVTRRDQERNARILELESCNTSSDKKQATILRRLRRAEEIKALFEKIEVSASERATSWSDTNRNTRPPIG